MSIQAPRDEVTCPGHSQEDVELRSPGCHPVRRTTCRRSIICLLFGVFVGQGIIVCWAQACDLPGSGWCFCFQEL